MKIINEGRIGLEFDGGSSRKIKKTKAKDKKIVRVVEEIEKAEVKILKRDKWQIEEKLVLKEEKVYIPKNKNYLVAS